jgi:hypothetical protein
MRFTCIILRIATRVSADLSSAIVFGTTVLRITYACYGALRDDVARQMDLGALLIKIDDTADLTLDTPVELELVLPDGSALRGPGSVLQVLAGHGVAVCVDPKLTDQARRAAIQTSGPAAIAPKHERITPRARPRLPTATQAAAFAGAEIAVARRPSTILPAPLGAGEGRSRRALLSQPPPLTDSAPPRRPVHSPPPLFDRLDEGGGEGDIAAGDQRDDDQQLAPLRPLPPPAPDAPPSHGAGRAEKIQRALHGTRDDRHAILRDRDRTLYPFVLENPQLDADDVVAIARSAQVGRELLAQIGERRDWLQRPAVALALVRNPRTPPDLAVRALDHVPTDALRQLARGTGVLPHVCQAARKKLLG